jgi:hypothetical protein
MIDNIRDFTVGRNGRMVSYPAQKPNGISDVEDKNF